MINVFSSFDDPGISRALEAGEPWFVVPPLIDHLNQEFDWQKAGWQAIGYTTEVFNFMRKING